MGGGRGAGKQNEIYEAVFGGHFLMTYFYRGGHGSSPPVSAAVLIQENVQLY